MEVRVGDRNTYFKQQITKKIKKTKKKPEKRNKKEYKEMVYNVR